MRPFAATNQPWTCLWCGWKLRHAHNVQTETEHFTPKKCEHCGSKKIAPDGSRYFCEDCQRDVRHLRKKIIAREPRFDKPGDYGDGFFCGLRCGYQFAEAFAGFGRRLNPKPS